MDRTQPDHPIERISSRALETLTKQLRLKAEQQTTRKWLGGIHLTTNKANEKSFLTFSTSLKLDLFCDAIHFSFGMREK